MTWQKNSRLPQFLEFRPEILHAYFWMHMQSNNDEKKYRFFDPFTGEAPLKKNVSVRWPLVVSHWCSKPHTQINFPKIWVREKYVESFKVKCQYWTPSWKQFRKKNQTSKIIIFSAPQSLNPSCWPQNAPCKNRTR